MALPLPNLDDRTYEQLVSEMIALLPRHNKEWTNQNPSDPGVMLLELFAYLIEMDIFQLNRITPASYSNFLKLVEVDTSAYSNPPKKEEIQNGVIQALQNLAYIRTISETDMNDVIESVLLPKGIISRVFSFSGRYIKKEPWYLSPLGEVLDNIERPVKYEGEKEGYTLIILSADTTPWVREQENPCLKDPNNNSAIDRSLFRYTLDDAALADVEEALRERRILTNRLYVHQAQVRRLIFYIKIVPEKTADLEALPQKITDNLLDFYCPVWGGEEETGFALGRPFKVTEAISVIEDVLGVDYTEEFKAWYEVSPGVWESISQIYEPQYYEQVWLDNETATITDNMRTEMNLNAADPVSGITIDLVSLGNL